MWLKAISWLEKIEYKQTGNARKIKYWCQDETRLGLKTLERKRITAYGIKPIGKVQWQFSAYYLYGVIQPATGESLFLEFSHLDHQCFQIFLDELSKYSPDCLNVVQLDQGRFHLSHQLKIPKNILLIFQPPASPELNPIERFWQYLKHQLTWKLSENLDELKTTVRDILQNITPEQIISLSAWDFLLEALTVA